MTTDKRDPREVVALYTNHSGETRRRRLYPVGSTMHYGKSRWHVGPDGLPVEQWYVSAVDAETDKYRDFSLSGLVGHSTFQDRVNRWVVDTFGIGVAVNPEERALRFLEEALELSQSCGLKPWHVRRLTESVFSRPAGEVQQEVGGVMTTLAALCFPRNVEMYVCAEDELARVLDKSFEIRAKNQTKIRSGAEPTEEELDPVVFGVSKALRALARATGVSYEPSQSGQGLDQDVVETCLGILAKFKAPSPQGDEVTHRPQSEGFLPAEDSVGVGQSRDRARVGRRVPRTVYLDDLPLFVAHSHELAEEVVQLLNEGSRRRVQLSNLEEVAALVEEVANGWRGANGGVFTIRAMSLEVARRLLRCEVGSKVGPDWVERSAKVAAELDDTMVRWWPGTSPVQHPSGRGAGHLRWLAEQIKTKSVGSETKTCRWLGYLQGALVDLGMVDLETCKRLNLESKT